MNHAAGERRYLPGLDGLRAYAAISVLFFHAFKNPHRWFLLPEMHRLPLFLSGGDAVSLFFVLSGFLITFLLLEEKERTGDVGVGRFYRKRVARILPLYYLVLALGFWVLPWLCARYPKAELTSGQQAMMLTILSNVAIAFRAEMATVGHLWSIGVEEQFYLAWPLLLRWARRPSIVIAAALALNPVALAVVLGLGEGEGMSEGANTLLRFLGYTRIQCMALGGAAAVILRRGNGWRAALLHPATLALSVGVAASAYAFFRSARPAPACLRTMVLAAAFAVLVAQAATGRFQGLLESRPFRFLGRISYGLYMYHPLVIGIVAPFLLGSSTGKVPPEIACLYVLCVLGCTIAVATASYVLIETPLLRWAGSSRKTVDSSTVAGAGPVLATPVDLR